MSPTQKISEKPDPRWFKMSSVGDALPSLVSKAFVKRGFMMPELVLQWPEIAGGWLAEHTRPDKISFPAKKRTDGTLYLLVSTAMAPAVQCSHHLILDKVNSFFGFQAVVKLVIQQRPTSMFKP
jgi:hypothetical protein